MTYVKIYSPNRRCRYDDRDLDLSVTRLVPRPFQTHVLSEEITSMLVLNYHHFYCVSCLLIRRYFERLIDSL